ncbi:MAG: serine hydrolase, partial [Tenericutes bacterium]|nr:serine hydrolase [Mycoplasmatota bacterium]
MVFPKSEFQKASVKEADLSKGLLADMFDEIEEKKLNIHSMMLLKDGNRVFRAGAYDHDETTIENVYSVAKAFTSVAIGILSDMNLINLDDYVLFFFSKEVTEYLPG